MFVEEDVLNNDEETDDAQERSRDVSIEYEARCWTVIAHHLYGVLPTSTTGACITTSCVSSMWTRRKCLSWRGTRTSKENVERGGELKTFETSLSGAGMSGTTSRQTSITSIAAIAS